MESHKTIDLKTFYRTLLMRKTPTAQSRIRRILTKWTINIYTLMALDLP
jgi:hypothetical protein